MTVTWDTVRPTNVLVMRPDLEQSYGPHRRPPQERWRWLAQRSDGRVEPTSLLPLHSSLVELWTAPGDVVETYASRDDRSANEGREPGEAVEGHDMGGDLVGIPVPGIRRRVRSYRLERVGEPSALVVDAVAVDHTARFQQAGAGRATRTTVQTPQEP